MEFTGEAPTYLSVVLLSVLHVPNQSNVMITDIRREITYDAAKILSFHLNIQIRILQTDLLTFEELVKRIYLLIKAFPIR